MRKDGRTDGQMEHDEANSRFSQFCERAKKHVRNVVMRTRLSVTLFVHYPSCSILIPSYGE
jgi:hypothetical protein